MHYLEIRLGNLWYHESPPRKIEHVMLWAAIPASWTLSKLGNLSIQESHFAVSRGWDHFIPRHDTSLDRPTSIDNTKVDIIYAVTISVHSHR
jgi:hypothetical protein